MKYFLVEDVVMGDKRTAVIGRAGHRWEVGDVFNCKFKFKPRKYPEEMGKPEEVDVDAPVNLKIVGVEMYQKPRPHLDTCDTGILWLEGELEIEHGWDLGFKE